MVLPEPVLSDDDIKVAEEVIRNPSSLISNAWSKAPTKLAILRALFFFHGGASFDRDMVYVLAQKVVRFLHSYSLEVEEVHC